MRRTLKKSVTKDRVAAIIEKQIPAQERVELAAALARGLVMSHKDKKTGEITNFFATKPDLDAIRFLEEYATGKPVQKSQIAVEDGFSCIIVPPMAAAVNIAELRFERDKKQESVK
jgi:hypothetical protein